MNSPFLSVGHTIATFTTPGTKSPGGKSARLIPLRRHDHCGARRSGPTNPRSWITTADALSFGFKTRSAMSLPDSDEPFDPDLFSVEIWAQVPEPARKKVEQHVATHLPDDILAKLRELHARGLPISTDPAFFHFG